MWGAGWADEDVKVTSSLIMKVIFSEYVALLGSGVVVEG